MEDLQEIKHLRKKREKHFLKKDGTMIAQIYPEDVHYLKNGFYEEIENHLENKNRDNIVTFGKEVQEKLLEIEKNGHFFSMDLKNKSNMCPNIKRKEVTYPELLKGIDFCYQIQENKIKESIILKEKNNLSKLEFIIETDLNLEIQDKIIKVKENDKTILSMEQLFMIDQNGKTNYQIYYTLEKKDHYYELTLVLDPKWLEKASYPVIIDPTITQYNTEGNVYDTYIYPGDTGVDRNQQDYLKIGTENVGGKNITNRALLKFDLPNIGTGSQIIDAEIDLIGYPEYTPYLSSKEITMHRVIEDWNEETANWDMMNDKYDPRIEDYNKIYFSTMNTSEITELQHNSFNITNLVKKWYSGIPNYGVLFKSHREIYDKNSKIAKCFSKNNHVIGDNPKPLLIIHYRNQNGIEPYMDYQEQNFTDGMTLTNLYNGNLVSTFDVGKTISGKFPVTLSMIYNTNDVILKTDYGYGLGWQLSFHQHLKERIIDHQSVLEYKDADGTLHYFYQGKNLESKTVIKEKNTYYDEDGLSLTITKQNENYVMKDKDSNIITFTKKGEIWYLTSIMDNKHNIVQVHYDDRGRIDKIIDGNGQQIQIVHEASRMVITHLNETVILKYQKNKLIQIENKNGVVQIHYNKQNLIDYIIDVNLQKTEYEYYSMIPYRIKRIKEYGGNEVSGNFIELEYGFHSTTIKDSKNNYYTYSFNDQGNTIGITTLNQKEEIRKAYGKSFQYGSKTSSGEMNKLMREGKFIGVTKNYLENSSFEGDQLLFSPNQVTNLEFVNHNALTGNRCLFLYDNGMDPMYMPNMTYQISVPKEKYYTFSAYILADENAYIGLSYVDSNNQKVNVYTDIEKMDRYERYDVTIFYPEDANSNLELSVGCDSWHSCYIDDIQLEEGEVANLYNLMNVDFDHGYGGFTADVYSAVDENINPLEIVTLSNENKALKWHTEPDWSQMLKKQIPISGKKGDVYTLYFWYKNEGIEKDVPGISQGKTMIQFDYIDPDSNCTIPRGDYCSNNTEWQFYEQTFEAEYDYNSLTLTLFDSHANDLYVTNFALYKPVRASYEYWYDENGNVTNIEEPNNGSKVLSYDQNNQLISMMDVKGSNFVYEYDSTKIDQILRAMSATGISNEIEYDQLNNPVVTRIYNKNQREEIEGNYFIRLKGTKKYFKNDFGIYQLRLQENDCSHDKFKLIKSDSYYKIAPVDNPNYTLYVSENMIGLSGKNASLFELIKNQDKSYKLKLKDTNRYITFEENQLKISEEQSNQDFYFEEDSKLFMENIATYTDDGRFMKSIKNTLEKVTTYDTDSMTGLIKSITDANGNMVQYTYNDKNQMTKIKEGEKEVSYIYDNQNQLSQILHGNKAYNFVYDEFLNIKNINIGNQTLITNNYEKNNGNINSSIYGNGHTISYLYDDFDRIKTIKKMDDTYTYCYDNLGNIAKIKSNQINEQYYYDPVNRLVHYKNNQNHIFYHYNKEGNIEEKEYNFNFKWHRVSYEYNQDNAVTKIQYDNTNDPNINIMRAPAPGDDVTTYVDNITYEYDELGRLKEKNINDRYKTKYDYVTNGYKTSFLLDTLTVDKDRYHYQYDNLDHITDIYYNTVLQNHYDYDRHSQLIKDTDYKRKRKFVYTYDNVGNILSKKEYDLEDHFIREDIYEYQNANWEDQLTKFNGEGIRYDEIGNPVRIGAKVLSWINGKQLQKIEDPDNTIIYRYNKDSVRTQKTVNGKETHYYLENNHILAERSRNNMIYYIRDENENLIGLKYNDENYYYVKNAHEDIIGILDGDYQKIVDYQYDAYGKILSITDENGIEIIDQDHIAHINPFRYRSYYYDKETDLYYLNSRYYNPNWGRFINADHILGEVKDLNYNLYWYCNNNVINHKDESGNLAEAAVGIGLAGAFMAGMLPGVYNAARDLTKGIIQIAQNVVEGVVSVAREITQASKRRTSLQEQKHSVYTLYDVGKEKVEYVGRTVDIKRRQREHEHSHRQYLELQVKVENLSYQDARIKEEELIIKYGTLNKSNKINNQRHGISPNSSLYQYVNLGEVRFPDSETYVGG